LVNLVLSKYAKKSVREISTESGILIITVGRILRGAVTTITSLSNDGADAAEKEKLLLEMTK